MKQIFILTFFILLLMTSCSSVRQATNKVGQTDDLYFTASDTRKIDRVSQQELESRRSLQEQSVRNESYAGSYTNSYSNRFRHFGNNRSFYYQNRPTIVPVVSYNPFTGWNTSFAVVDPRFMGMNTFNSPFSPYYGWNTPFNDPFYSAGWGGTWMTGHYPFYSYNPYMYNNCFPGMYGFNDPYRYNGFYGNGYNSYYGQNNRNNWGSNRNNNNNSQPTNYSRRTGSSNNMPASNARTPAPQGSAQPATPSSGNRWYSGSTSPSSSGSSSSSSSSSSSGSSSSGSSSGRWYSGSTSPSSGGSSSSGSSSSGSSGSSGGGGSTRRR